MRRFIYYWREYGLRMAMCVTFTNECDPVPAARGDGEQS